jgi:O-antigen/teichoic acid export membrane protein
MAVRGASWTGGAQVGGYLLNLAALGVATRFVEIGAFGVEAAAVTIVGAAGLVADAGVGRAVVQRAGLRPGHITAAMTVSLIGAVLVPGLLWQTSGWWGRIFADPRVAEVLPVMCVGLGFASAGAVPRGLMERKFGFGRLSIIDLAATVASALALSLLAIGGHGLWSLVWAYVARSAVLGLGPMLLCGGLRPCRFSVEQAGDLVRFGWKWSGAQLLSYGQQNLDYLVLARFLGSTSLGYYTLAYRLIAFPQVRISQVVSRVTFSAFAAIQADLPRLRAAYFQTVSAIALLAFPLMAGIGLLADPGVLLLYGEDKALTVLAVQILAVGGAARSVGSPAGLVYLALGRTGLALAWTFGAGVVVLAGILVGVAHGLPGVALAVSLTGVGLTVVSQFVVNRLIRSGFRDFWDSMRAALLGVAITAGSTVLVFRLVSVSDLSALGALAGAGGILYLLCVRRLSPEIWTAVIVALKRTEQDPQVTGR